MLRQVDVDDGSRGHRVWVRDRARTIRSRAPGEPQGAGTRPPLHRRSANKPRCLGEVAGLQQLANLLGLERTMGETQHIHRTLLGQPRDGGHVPGLHSAERLPTAEPELDDAGVRIDRREEVGGRRLDVATEESDAQDAIDAAV